MSSTPRGDLPPDDDSPDAGQRVGAAKLKAVGEMKFGDHLCLSYDNDEERRAILTTYVRDGLAADHKVVYLSDDAAPAAVLEWFQRGPQTADLDLPAAMDEGHLVVRTAEEVYMATGRFDPDEIISWFATELDLAAVQGYQGVRVTGEETFSLRGWPGTERFAEFERKVDEVFRLNKPNAMAICQYDRRWFDPPRLRKLESYHVGKVVVNDTFDNGTLKITPTFTPPGLALAGAIDESTFPAVVDALRAVTAQSGNICLDLSRLEFCDMAGLRALIGAHQPDTGMSRQVILREMPEYLGLMMRIAGWDGLPGVFVEEGVR